MKPRLTKEDFARAAAIIGCEPEVVEAITMIEAPRGGFLESGEPVILFEPFLFGDLTKHKFDDKTVTIDNHVYPLSLNRRNIGWSVKNAQYGTNTIQHQKLQAAAAFDRDSALEACSWGKFQILGSNYHVCGYDSLQNFMNAMYESEAKHLEAFLGFIKGNNMRQFLIDKNWDKFAIRYNGPKQDKGTTNPYDDYDWFLSEAYRKLKA